MVAVKAAILAIAVFTIIWLGRPDKGGVKRCQNLSRLYSLSEFVNGEKLVFAWKPFEIRYRFTMRRTEFGRFKEYTLRQGFSPWVDGGGCYGSFEEESTSIDPLYYTSSSKPMKDEWKLFYRPSTEELNIIYFNSR